MRLSPVPRIATVTRPPKFRLAALLSCAFLAGCAAVPSRNDDIFSRVTPGMTGDEVLALLGAPDEKMPFPALRAIAWDYRYYDSWGYLALFSVTFGADGRALTKTHVRLNDGGDHGGS
jgi:hypothetical protein